jgi:TetR/AcrR family transcriptional repressor of bet genes
VNDAKMKMERPRTHAEINDFRRRALIEGTLRSLAKFGIAGTTVRSICQEAGTSRGLIGHYFESKEHLLEVAFRHLFSTISEYVKRIEARAGPDPLDQLMALPQAVFSTVVFTDQNRDAFLSFWHELRFNELVRQANREAYGDYQERTESLFERVAASLGVQIDALEAALGLITMIDGMWLGVAINDQFARRDVSIRTCQNYIRLQLGLPLAT